MIDKLQVTFCSFPDFASNAKPLYEYMKKRYKNSMELSWVVNSKIIQSKMKNAGIETYIYGTEEYYKHMEKVNVIISTHCNLIKEKRDGILYIDLGHGIGMKTSGHLIKGVTPFDVQWYDETSKKMDYFIVPSVFWQVIFASIFGINAERVLPLGYPKFDEIKNPNAKSFLSKVLETDVNKYNKTLMYTPTLTQNYERKMEVSLNQKNIFNFNDEYDEEVLKKYLEENNYLLCIKLHPSETNIERKAESKYIKYITEKMLEESDITVTSIINAADVLISDYSSLIVEFSFLKKPVIYLDGNEEEYIKNRGIVFENTEFWKGKYSASNIETLLNSISNSLNSDNKEIKNYSLLFGSLQDGGCKNICDFFFDDAKISKNVKYYKSKEEILEDENKKLHAIINEKNKMILEDKVQMNSYKGDLDKVYNSKGWKMLEKIRKIIK